MKTLTIDHEGNIFVSWLVINDKPVRGAAGCLEHVQRWAARCGVSVTYTERAKQRISNLPGFSAIPAQLKNT